MRIGWGVEKRKFQERATMWNLDTLKELPKVQQERRTEKQGTVSDRQVSDTEQLRGQFYPSLYPKSHVEPSEGFEQRFNSWLTCL